MAITTPSGGMGTAGGTGGADGTGRAAGRVVLLGVVGVALVPVLVTVILRVTTDLPTFLLFGDPAQILEAPFYVGYVGAIFNVVWVIGATVCLFSAWLLPSTDQAHACLRTSGLITAFLALDDLLLIHDELLVDVVGIREPVTFAVYGLVLLAYLWTYRNILFHGPHTSLVITALLLFGLSVLVDIPKLSTPGTGVLEDGAKFVGTASWTAALTWLSTTTVRRHLTSTDLQAASMEVST